MGRNLCAVVASFLLLAGCGGMLPTAPTSNEAASATLNAKASPKPLYSVSAVNGGGTYGHPTWVSTRPGLTSGSLYVEWPDDAVVITPTGSSYALTDDAQMTVRQRNGQILGITLYIQDIAGPAGIQHRTDEIAVEAVIPSGEGFVIQVRKDGVPVHRLKGHTGGPLAATIGAISVGDIVYVPAS